MNFKTIYDRLKYYEEYQELCMEDVLIILNAVYMNLYEDNGTAAVECRVDEPDVMVDELTSQLYGLLELCRTHSADIDAAGGGELHEVEEELQRVHEKCAEISAKLGGDLETRKQLQLEKERLDVLDARQKEEQSRIHALNQEIAELRKSIEAHDGTAFAQTEAQRDALMAENQSLKERHEALLCQMDSLQEDNFKLHTAIASAENGRDAAEKEYQGLMDSIRSLEEERDALKLKTDALEEQRITLNGALIMLNSDIAAAAGQTSELTAKIDEKAAEKENIQVLLDQRQEEYNTIDQAYRTIKSKINGLEEAIKTRTQEIPGEQQQLDDLMAELEPLNAAHSELQRRICEAEAQTDGMRARLQELQGALAQKAEFRENVVAELTRLAREEADRLTGILEGVNEEIADIHAQIADLLTRKIPEAKEKLAYLRKTIAETSKEKEKLEAQITEGDMELAGLVEELAQKRKDAGTLGTHRQRNEQLQQMIDDLQPKLEEVERLEAANIALAKKNEVMQKRYEEGAEMIARVHRDAERLAKLLTKERQLEIERAAAQFAAIQEISANLKTDSAILYQEPFTVSAQLSADLEQCFQIIKRLEYAVRTYTDMVSGGR